MSQTQSEPEASGPAPRTVKNEKEVRSTLGTVRVDDPGVILHAIQEVIQVRSNSSNRVRILLIAPEL